MQTASDRAVESVLLVDDDDLVAANLSALLESAGIAVEAVSRGADVIPAIERRRPDAVILDIGLADVDGITVCTSIGERWPDLRVILSSGHGDQKALDGISANVTFLQKPYDFDVLLAALTQNTLKPAAPRG